MTKTKSSTNNWTMIGTLTSVFSLIMFLATTNAFVVVIPKVAPADSASREQASTSFGAPLGGDGRRVGAGGVLSRIDVSGAAEAKKNPLKIPIAGDYTVCGRSTCALHVFKGLEVRPCHTSNICLQHGSNDSTVPVTYIPVVY